MPDTVKPQGSPIDQAIQALDHAFRTSQGADSALYATALQGLLCLREAIEEHDGLLDWREQSPTGEDYNWVLDQIGINNSVPDPITGSQPLNLL